MEVNELPTNIEILKEIEQSERNALNTARNLGLISGQKTQQTTYTCKVPPYDSKPKNNMQTNVNETIVIPNLKNIKLKNFAGVLKQKQIDDETGPYAKIINGDKTIVVKKTSLCWLLRTEGQKLSSDRLQRVQCSTNYYGVKKKNE